MGLFRKRSQPKRKIPEVNWASDDEDAGEGKGLGLGGSRKEDSPGLGDVFNRKPEPEPEPEPQKESSFRRNLLIYLLAGGGLTGFFAVYLAGCVGT